MKATGITRKVDELGRIVLPKDIRARYDIEEKDPLEIYVEDDKIIIKKFQVVCAFCRTTDNLFSFKDKSICKTCAAEIAEFTKES